MRPFLAAMFSLAIIMLAPAIGAGEPGPTIISITDAWARASIGGSTASVVYLLAKDPSSADRLVSAATPIAEAASLHESRVNNGVMEMRPIEGLPIGPDKPLRLAPGGYHIMLTGLKQPLKVGDHFPITLTFEHAGPVTATVAVQPLGAPGPAGMSGSM